MQSGALMACLPDTGGESSGFVGGGMWRHGDVGRQISSPISDNLNLKLIEWVERITNDELINPHYAC